MSENNQDNPIRTEKRKKLNVLREQGIDPYPHNYERNGHLGEIRGEVDGKTEAGDKLEGSVFRVAGRLMTRRPMGKAAFFNIQDQSGSMQCYLKKAELSEKDLIAY